MEKPSVKIKPKGTRLDYLILTKASVKATEEHEFEVVACCGVDKEVALYLRAESEAAASKFLSHFKPVTRIAAYYVPDLSAPVEKAAQNHGVTVGCSGAVGVQDGAVIALNVSRSNERGGKL